MSKSLSKTIYVFAWQNSYFLYVFDSFSLLFLFLCPRANRSLCSSLSHSRHSLQKSDHEQFGTSRSGQKSDRSDSQFFMSESFFHTFAHKKRAIYLKNHEQIPIPSYGEVFYHMVLISQRYSQVQELHCIVDTDESDSMVARTQQSQYCSLGFVLQL